MALPPAVQEFAIDGGGYLAGIDRMLAATDKLAASADEAVASVDRMASSLDRAAGSDERLEAIERAVTGQTEMLTGAIDALVGITDEVAVASQRAADTLEEMSLAEGHARDEALEAAAALEALGGAANNAGGAGNEAGSSFLGQFRARTRLIGAGVILALAGLPALAAAGGAATGIAFGAALLIGSKKVKGPLYDQFHSMLQGVLSVMRTSALPLLQPLQAAFAQVGKWAASLKPLLTAVFASLGPLVQPLVKGVEGLVSGPMRGFLTMMQSARPAVQAVAGVLSGLGSSVGKLLAQMTPAIRSSSQFISGFGKVLLGLLPVVGGVANTLAGLLGPVMKTLGSSVMPVLDKAILSIFKALAPLIPGIAGLASQLLKLAAQAVIPLIGPVTSLISTLAKGLAPILAPLTKAIAQVGQQMGGSLTGQIALLMGPLTTLMSSLLRLAGSVLVPLIPPIMKLYGALETLEMSGIVALLAPLATLAAKFAGLGATVLQTLIPPLQTLIGWLTTVVNVASRAIGALEGLIGIHASSGGGSSATVGGLPGGSSEAFVGGLGGPGDPSPSFPTYSAPSGFGGWAGGDFGAASAAAGGGGTSAAHKRATAAAKAAAKAAAAHLAALKKQQQQLAKAMGASVSRMLGSGVTETMPAAVAAAGKLMKQVSDALDKGKITSSQAQGLTQKIQAEIQSRQEKLAKTMKVLGLKIRAGLLSSLEDAGSAAAVKTAVSKLVSYVQKAWSVGDISTRSANSLTSWLERDNKRLQSLAAQRQSLAATIKAADAYAASTTSSARDFAGLSNVTGSMTSGGIMYSGNILAGMQNQLKSVNQFTAAVRKLGQLGLNKNLIGQIIQMGPEQGLQVANSLINGPLSVLKSLNTTEAGILAGTDALGKTAADAMYDSGKNAGKGFLSGLESQQKAITKMMDQIAESMVDTIKKDLKISSPSLVMDEHGQMVAMGLAQGMERGVPGVKGAAKMLAGATSLTGTGGASGLGGASGGGDTYHFQLTVNGFVGSERELGQELYRVLQPVVLQKKKHNSGNNGF